MTTIVQHQIAMRAQTRHAWRLKSLSMAYLGQTGRETFMDLGPSGTRRPIGRVRQRWADCSPANGHHSCLQTSRFPVWPFFHRPVTPPPALVSHTHTHRNVLCWNTQHTHQTSFFCTWAEIAMCNVQLSSILNFLCYCMFLWSLMSKESNNLLKSFKSLYNATASMLLNPFRV